MFDDSSTDLLLSKADCPFLKMDLVKFLSGIHETSFQAKVSTNRAIRIQFFIVIVIVPKNFSAYRYSVQPPHICIHLAYTLNNHRMSMN